MMVLLSDKTEHTYTLGPLPRVKLVSPREGPTAGSSSSALTVRPRPGKSTHETPLTEWLVVK
jgi:hypothetical protein